MFRFADPGYLLMLLPTAAAGVAAYRRGVRTAMLFPSRSDPTLGEATWRVQAARLGPALVLLGLVLATVALARPQIVESVSYRTANAIAIEMVLDVSGSMEALDMSTAEEDVTRLDAVKEAFVRFIEKRPDDQAGIVSFGGFARTVAPLTLDHSALVQMLQTVNVPTPETLDGGQTVTHRELLTAVGDGLATACARLEHAEPDTRIIVLLTDGESNADAIPPEQAARAAAEMGIRVYTIGVGASGDAPFRTHDEFGREALRYAPVDLDEDLLKEIAAVTDGRYFHVTDTNGLSRVLAEIDDLEKTEVEFEVYSQYDDLASTLLGPSILLILLGAAMNVAALKRVI